MSCTRSSTRWSRPISTPTPIPFPIEASSGENKRHRLNQRGNRQLNWAIHVAAITQLRQPYAGREYYDRKRAEGKNSKEAIRALKRQLSNVIYRSLIADARRVEQ